MPLHWVGHLSDPREFILGSGLRLPPWPKKSCSCSDGKVTRREQAMQRDLKQRRITPPPSTHLRGRAGDRGSEHFATPTSQYLFTSDLLRRCFPKTVTEVIARNEGDGILYPKIVLSTILDFRVFTSCLPMRMTEQFPQVLLRYVAPPEMNIIGRWTWSRSRKG